jgi:GNAT superfamily N-acetyltransferase
MELQRFTTVEGFLALAKDYLVDREAEHCLMLGICEQLLSQPGLYKEPPYFAVATDEGTVYGCALQTPPWELVLSEMDARRAVDLIVEDRAILSDPGTLPGVTGPTALSERFATLWSQKTGMPTKLAMRERAFSLGQVIPPALAPGRMRRARESDRDLLYQWLVDFTEEALHGHMPGDAGAMADRWTSGERTMQLWIDNGHPVSMCGVGSQTPHGVRIGPVYTPSDLRNRGYASNLVAQAAEAELAKGRRFVFLFTDLANPTSNHIYQELGFEGVTDIDRWSFGDS